MNRIITRGFGRGHLTVTRGFGVSGIISRIVEVLRLTSKISMVMELFSPWKRR